MIKSIDEFSLYTSYRLQSINEPIILNYRHLLKSKIKKFIYRIKG